MRSRSLPEHRRPASVVDIHAHYFPETWLRLIEREGGAAGASIDRSDPRGPVLRIGDGVRVGQITSGFRDLDVRRRDMDRRGVDVQALSLTHPMVYWAAGGLATRLAQAMNDALAEAHEQDPTRIVGLATLPMQDVTAAVAELHRAARLPGIRGVYLGTNVNGQDLSHPEFEPVWKTVSRLGLPVFLHPLNVIGGERLRPFYLDYLLGNGFDTAVAAAHLMFGGVLDRWPDLRVCLAHGGGALPSLIGRLDHGWRVRPECRGLPRRPSAYLGRFTFDTITHDRAALAALVGRVGGRRLMLGSDYCFPLGDDRPVRTVTALGLGRDDEAAVLGGTARRLLRLAQPRRTPPAR